MSMQHLACEDARVFRKETHAARAERVTRLTFDFGDGTVAEAGAGRRDQVCKRGDGLLALELLCKRHGGDDDHRHEDRRRVVVLLQQHATNVRTKRNTERAEGKEGQLKMTDGTHRGEPATKS